MAITGSLAVLLVDNMPPLPILVPTEQVAQLLGQMLSSIMSTITISQRDSRFLRAAQSLVGASFDKPVGAGGMNAPGVTLETVQ